MQSEYLINSVVYTLAKFLRQLHAAIKNAVPKIGAWHERKRYRNDVPFNIDYLTAVFETTDDAIISVDEKERICYFNQGAVKVFGYSSPEVLGQPIDLLLPLSFKDSHHQYIRSFSESKEISRKMDERNEVAGRRKDGTKFPAEVLISKYGTRNGVIFTVILRDITSRMQTEERLQYMSYHDALTGLPNRTLFENRLEYEIDISSRTKRPFTLIILVIHHLKEINDTLGHHRGDFVLQQMASRLKEGLRKSDTIARLSGNDFAVLLPNVGQEFAISIALKFQKLIETSIIVEGTPIGIEASMGIALCPDHGNDPCLLLQYADVASRTAWCEKNVFSIYNAECDPNSHQRLALFNNLRQAIKNNELLLYYQPKVDIATGMIISVEALIRWQHPELGFIPPDDFIPLAEKTGLIKTLSQWVLDEAFSQCNKWIREGININISINLSTYDIQSDHISGLISDLIDKWKISPKSIELEITESGIMSESERALKNMIHLNNMGFTLSVDDFGTGHSSLGYLSKLPVQYLKIDKCFIHDMLENPNNAMIVRSIIDLAHNLNLKVVAEGVENKATLTKLASLGCDVAQGYHFAKPQSPDEITRVLPSFHGRLK